VNDFEKDINRSLDQFTQANSLNENLLGDLEIYMFQIGILMKYKQRNMRFEECRLRKNACQGYYLKGKNHE
jgi:hypothetical protein